MRLNWFSPLPPARTGIAEYTAQVLPELCLHAEVVLWTDQQEWGRPVEALAAVRRFDPDRVPWGEVESADLNVYQMGNSPFHTALWRVSRRVPGVMVLHDLCLTDFCRQALGGPVEFAAAVGRCYGERAEAMADALLTGQLPAWAGRLFPLTEEVVGDSLGVVVHSRKGLRALRAGTTPVGHLALPYPASPRPAVKPERPGGPGGPHRLVIFGHLNSNRGLDKVLAALAAFPWRERFRLDVYGTVVQRELVESQIAWHGIGDLVRLHGPVADGVLDAALDWADLAINLRYPSMGEASHSQLRLWDRAVPSVVTRVGWYAELPADAVAKVRPGEEAEGLQVHLLALLRDPEAFRRMGERGREELERRHAVGAYVRDLLAFGRQVSGGAVRPTENRVAARVAEAASGWAKETMSEWLQRGAADAFAEMVGAKEASE